MVLLADRARVILLQSSDGMIASSALGVLDGVRKLSEGFDSWT